MEPQQSRQFYQICFSHLTVSHCIPSLILVTLILVYLSAICHHFRMLNMLHPLILILHMTKLKQPTFPYHFLMPSISSNFLYSTPVGPSLTIALHIHLNMFSSANLLDIIIFSSPSFPTMKHHNLHVKLAIYCSCAGKALSLVVRKCTPWTCTICSKFLIQNYLLHQPLPLTNHHEDNTLH